MGLAHMDTSLSSAVQAMSAGERRLDAIATNLANIQAPGYKRTATFQHVLETQHNGRPSRQILTRSGTDFSQGPVEDTGNPFDLALLGDGFFAVETPSGEGYTRNGRFHLDPQGVLLDDSGNAVVWDGARGTLNPIGKEVSIDGTGFVRQGVNDIGRLKLIDFAARERLQLDTQGYFRASQGMEQQAPTAQVRARAIERANTESIDELVSMIRVQRHYDLASNIIRTVEQSYSRLNQPR
jgi:flagellar basal body rod protein FlgG